MSDTPDELGLELARIEGELERAERVHGPDHPATVEAKAERAAALCELGRYEDALAVATELLEKHGMRADVKAEDLGVADARNTRVVSLIALGRYEEALQEAVRLAMVAADDSALGKSSPAALEARVLAVQLRTSLGQFEEALSESSDILAVLGRDCTTTSDDIRSIRLARANSFLGLGQDEKARKEVLAALALADSERDDDSELLALRVLHERLARDSDPSSNAAHTEGAARLLKEQLPLLRNRVAAVQAAGDDFEAIRLQRTLVAALSELPEFGQIASETISERLRLVAMLSRADLSLQALDEANDIVVALADSDDPTEEVANIALAVAARGEALNALKRYDEALADFDYAIGIFTEAVGGDHPNTMRLRANRATVMHSLGRYQEAEREYSAVADALGGAVELGPNSCEVLQVRALRAGTLGRVDPQLAYDAYTSLIEEYENHPEFGRSHPSTLELRAERTRGVLSLGGASASAISESEAALIDRGELDGSASAIRNLAQRGLELVAIGRNVEGAQDLIIALDAADQHPELGPNAEETIHTATTLAVGFTALGRFQEALDLHTRALNFYRDEAGLADNDSRVLLVRSNRASDLGAVGRYVEALAESQAVLASCVDRADVDENTDVLTLSARSAYGVALYYVGQYEEALLQFSGVIEALEQHPEFGPTHPRTLISRGNLAATLSALGRPGETLAQHDAVVGAYVQQPGFHASHPDVLAARRKRAQALVEVQALGEARNEFDELLRLHDESLGALHPDSAQSRVELAALIASLGNDAEAFGYLMSGFAALDRTRYMLTDAASRESWRRRWEGVLGRLLLIASRRRDARLVAELVEIARVQGVPADESALGGEFASPILPLAGPTQIRSALTFDDPNTRDEVMKGSAALLLGLDALAPPPLVSVGGTSALADAWPGDSPPGTTVIALERVADDLVPPDAEVVIWWGQWVASNGLYQSVLVREEGAWRCEHVAPITWLSAEDPDVPQVQEEGNIARAIDAWRTASGQLVAGWLRGDAIGEGPLSTAAGEAAVLYAIGRLLVPEKLRELVGLAVGREPVWLVIAPAMELADIPFAFLPIEDPVRGGSSVSRIIDGAIALYCPSVAFSWALRRRHPDPASNPTHVHVSVYNPTGDLQHAQPLPDAETALGPGAANRDAVLNALGGAAGGLIHIAGHARTRTRRPADTSLQLSHDTSLTARDFMAADIHASIAILACCASAAPPTTTAEWLGLAPALMWAGTKTVLATLWPIMDDPFASRLERTLASCLVSTSDHPAIVLRTIQLQELRPWRGESAQGRPHPHHYSSYIALS